MRITILLAIMICLSGCTNVGRRHAKRLPKSANGELASVQKAGHDSLSAVGKVSYLSTADFRRLVMDYEVHTQEWVYDGKRPAVIDFYATWCRPCKMMSPIVEGLAKKYAGKVDFYKVDIDKEQELAAVFGIQSIPTFLFIPINGNPTMQMGAIPSGDFEKAVDEMLAK